MIWLVWRRQRVPLLVALTLVALVGATAVIGGLVLPTRVGAAAWASCGPPLGDWTCDSYEQSNHLGDAATFLVVLQLMMIVLPGVAGAVAGAGVFGADLSRGTHVFALTQSVPRLRWWLSGLLAAGVPVVAAVALVTAVISQTTQSVVDLFPGDLLPPRLFLTGGVVPAAYAVLAFCLAAGAGLLLRSTARALGVALAVQIAVLTTTLTLHPTDYLPPETVYIAPPASGDRTWATPPDGVAVEYGYVGTLGREDPLGTVLKPCGQESYADCLRASGYTGLYIRYQPAVRGRLFQALDSSVALALAAAALGAGLLGLRRRVH